MTLREALRVLESDPEADEAHDQVVSNNPILITGKLLPLSRDEANRLEYEVGPDTAIAPTGIRQALERCYGDELSPRERNLVVAGSELMALVIQQWVRLESIPEPEDPEV